MPATSTERGAAAVLVAASLILLLGFAAIAVDSGLAYDERRQEQGAVDAGALSAGLRTERLPTETGCASSGDLRRTSACNGAMVAIEVINQNFDAPFPVTAFADATRCTDAVFPGEFDPDIDNNGSWQAGIDGVVPITTSGQVLSCIRFNRNLSRVNILLPVTDVDTTFGRVLGRNSIGISARAEAEISQRPGEGIFPFAVGPSGSGANQACLFAQSTSNLDVSPCNGPTQGNFGLLGPQLYGDLVRGTPTICDSASEANRIAATLAMGADHVFARDTDVDGTMNDRTECPNANQWIDQVDVRTGNLTGSMETGLFQSIYGTEGRLLCKTGSSTEPDWHRTSLVSSDCERVNDRHADELDDTPLWEFITPGANAEALGQCPTGVGPIQNKVDMEDCLQGWRTWGASNSHAETLFSGDIASSPRFGWVPILGSDPASGGSGYYMITDFAPVYVQTIYLKCTATTCDVVFDPGEPSTGSCATPPAVSCGWPSTGNKDITAMTAFLLQTDMLTPELRDFPFAMNRLQVNLSD